MRKELTTKYGENPVFLENVSFYNADNVFYLPQNLTGDDQEWSTRWSYIVAHAGDNDIAIKIDKALKELEVVNPPLKNTLSKNLFVTLGASKEKLKSLIDNVNQISEERFQVEDLIGRTYEYFLQLYAASGTKKDGEFYTPACVVELIAEMIEPFSGTVYDPCCGSGGMFVQSMRFVDEHKGNKKAISVIGQESVQETWRLCKMNLAIRGIAHNLGRQNASAFTDDQHKDRKVDFIMANPLFNLKRWWADSLSKDPRWSGYGIPRESNANYAWILHMISKLDVNHGIAGFLLANGALGDSDDSEIRKNILLKDKVEAIIVLPRDMFYTTDISVTLWILNMNKGAFAKERVLTILRDFIYYPEIEGKEQEIVCRYPQFFGANNMVENVKNHLKPHGDGKGGTYFGATGCGKTYTMLFMTKLLMQRYSSVFHNPTIIIITDREDLNNQARDVFAGAKRYLHDDDIRAFESRQDLNDTLLAKESGGVYITTIQKFCESTGLLSNRSNIIYISDEAHRTQIEKNGIIKRTDEGIIDSKSFAQYLKASLPNATRVGFTGTPIDETIAVFGDIVDQYTMKESSDDGITVRIAYEPRLARVIVSDEQAKEIESIINNVNLKALPMTKFKQAKRQCLIFLQFLGILMC